jgi:hypothetical protein
LLWRLAFSLGVRSAKRSCWVIMFVSPTIRLFLKHHGYAQYAHLAPAIADSLAAGCLLVFYENRVRAFGRKLTFVLAYLSYRSIEQPCSKSVRANDVTNNWRTPPVPPSEIGKTK